MAIGSNRARIQSLTFEKDLHFLNFYLYSHRRKCFASNEPILSDSNTNMFASVMIHSDDKLRLRFPFSLTGSGHLPG